MKVAWASGSRAALHVPSSRFLVQAGYLRCGAGIRVRLIAFSAL
jgi:hypothetical protein